MMAVVALPPITFKQLPGSIARMQQTFSPGYLKRGFMVPMANRMQRETQDQFSRGKDPSGRLWKSASRATKYQGRFSKNYMIRPSGAPVTSSSVRLRDTGELRDSIHMTKVTAKLVTVEPVGDRNVEIALKKAYLMWGNVILGWTKARVKRANKKLEAYMLHHARKRPL